MFGFKKKFKPFTGSGVCDVCNAPLQGKKAYLVPNEVFYRSQKYREHQRNGFMAKMMNVPMNDAYFENLLRMDHSIGSAVCEDRIHLFE